MLLLEDLGHDTGIDLAALLAIGDDLAELVGHDLPGRAMAAGPLAPSPTDAVATSGVALLAESCHERAASRARTIGRGSGRGGASSRDR